MVRSSSEFHTAAGRKIWSIRNVMIAACDEECFMRLVVIWKHALVVVLRQFPAIAFMTTIKSRVVPAAASDPVGPRHLGAP